MQYAQCNDNAERRRRQMAYVQASSVNQQFNKCNVTNGSGKCGEIVQYVLRAQIGENDGVQFA